jgi:hypothetical protein
MRLHILEEVQGIKQTNDRAPSNTVYDKNRTYGLILDSGESGDGDSGNQTTSITHEDIQS